MLLIILLERFVKLLRHWKWFILYCVFIYVSLPFGPVIWKTIEHALGKTGRDLPYIIIGLVIFGTVSWFLLLKKKYWFQGLFIIGLAFAIFLMIANNLDQVAEKMHLVEYALLSVVIYSRINKAQSVTAVHFKVLLIGFIVGAIDEGIQYFVPGRVCDIRDVLLNAASVSLGQMLIYSIEHLC